MILQNVPKLNGLINCGGCEIIFTTSDVCFKQNKSKQTNNLPKCTTNVRPITYFGNFVFDFLLRDFLYNVFRLQGKMGKMTCKINKVLHTILGTLSPKTTKNEVTIMG